MNRISPFALLGMGWRTVRHSWLPLVATMLVFQLVTLFVVSPLIGWLFREALRANGMVALDFSSMRVTGGIGLTLTIIVVILLLAFWIAALQFVILLLMLRRAHEHASMSPRGILKDIRTIAKKLLRPSSFPLFFYLFVIIPLSGFGFASTLSQGISVPTFISGELMKSPTTGASWIGFMLVLAFLNLRFALSLPIFVLTKATGGRSIRQSWRLTRGWAAVRLVLSVIIVFVAAGAVTALLTIISALPTAFTDQLLPAASPITAAFSLGIAQVVGMALTACVITLIGAILLSLAIQREDQLATDLQTNGSKADPLHADAPTTAATASGSRRHTLVLVAGLLAVAVGFGFFHLGTMQQLSQHPSTLVLGHRGFSDNGAENTIEGLEAATRANADLVEIDVLQTADKRFVVMHDASLLRLTGQDLQVKDLTLDELTKITVTDQYGHTGKIPSLEEYVLRAKELDMPLLIELKLGGLDTPDHVDLLIDELDELDAIDSNIFHTLDLASAERLKQLRPDSTVGYILAFAGLDIPATNADFVVVEQWSATQEMQDAAYREGYGFFSWTVNEDAHIRELLRRDADGIITDHPDIALDAREEMQQETGLAGTLIDAFTRFVMVF